MTTVRQLYDITMTDDGKARIRADAYPDQFQSGDSSTRRTWLVQSDRACVTQTQTIDDVQFVAHIDSLGTLVEAEPDRILALLQTGDALPAYGLEDGPMSFVPTGRIFLRLSSSERLEDREAELANVGYTIEAVHSHFEFAGWLVAQDGSVADALQRCASLSDLDGVESCEPEMLSSVRRN